jgi:hypothetical protein
MEVRRKRRGSSPANSLHQMIHRRGRDAHGGIPLEELNLPFVARGRRLLARRAAGEGNNRREAKGGEEGSRWRN